MRKCVLLVVCWHCSVINQYQVNAILNFLLAVKNGSLAKEPTPIVFTRSEAGNTHYDENVPTPREQGRRKMKSSSEQLDQLSEINSLSSVTEGWFNVAGFFFAF